MATHVEIFLRPLEAVPVQSVVGEIAELVGTPLLREPKYQDEAYFGRREDVAVELFVNHGYEIYDDMPFATHPYMLRFRTLNRDVDNARSFMERTYGALKATGKFSIFSTYDLQYVLSEDIENPAAGTSS
ncbi:Uncharacterised protein [Amycolatopsis camponoti]|uniref:Uncharacterized protein n=1 Tax=Amycolatopsis camponoti TaxID=2606593 RepID=A0A6I8M977_9PSEU|nr:hypothetical protein [Amycolatopsis camponoti]VVJ24136.1 Uncharacterised protein [Amycolatopsis camponoti]